jgi:MoxR domain in the MoxR-vWA-beta-propeller ternary systems/AAA lid domain
MHITARNSLFQVKFDQVSPALLAAQKFWWWCDLKRIPAGPPGTAKSALILEIAKRISPQTGAGHQSFNYLMTRFTTPEELFGPESATQVSIPGAILDLIEQLRKELMGKGITISDRRWGQILDALQAKR